MLLIGKLDHLEPFSTNPSVEEVQGGLRLIHGNPTVSTVSMLEKTDRSGE
jgi:hypothetical protein